MLQIALAFCYVNLFSLFRLFFLCLESTQATVEGCGDTQFTADLCNVYNIRYMVYDTYIYIFICVVYSIPNAGPEVRNGTRWYSRYLPMRP